MSILHALLHDCAKWPIPAALAGVMAAAVILAALRTAGRAALASLRAHRAEDMLTVFAAMVATAVAMTGMWRFFGHVLHFTGPERVLLFAFIEIAAVTSAFRARRSVREAASHSAGLDGAAVWVLSAMSGVFSALDAGSAAASMFRLATPLVAAWLWERSLWQERARAGKGIHWKLSAERLLSLAGLADPQRRDASEADALRRVARLARAVRRARTTRGWRASLARRRVDVLLARAVEHADIAVNPGRQRMLAAHLGALSAAQMLIDADLPSPWDGSALGARKRTAPPSQTVPAPAAPGAVAADCASTEPDRATELAVTAPGTEPPTAPASEPDRAVPRELRPSGRPDPLAIKAAHEEWHAAVAAGRIHNDRTLADAVNARFGMKVIGRRSCATVITEARGEDRVTRLPRRAYWHQRIRAARDPLSKLARACDYLRAAAKAAEPAASRRPVLAAADTMQQAADDLLATLKESRR